jgi:hypothetical protein
MIRNNFRLVIELSFLCPRFQTVVCASSRGMTPCCQCSGPKKRQLVCPLAERDQRLGPERPRFVVRAVLVAAIATASATESSLVSDHCIVPGGQSLRERCGFSCSNLRTDQHVWIHRHTQPLSWHARAVRSTAIRYAASRRETRSRSDNAHTSAKPALSHESSFCRTSVRAQ